jgi:LacI family transcriptional regulator
MVEGGREAARELLIARPELTALFCFNDLVAVGALQACVDLGRAVPDDLAILGFDDIPLAALVTPPLSTCHVSRHDLGAQAMHLLLNRISGRLDEECKEIVLRPEIVVRDSTP